MTFDGIRRLSPYWSLALCYGVVTAVVLYLVLRYARKTWLELGEAAITGKVPEGKKKK